MGYISQQHSCTIEYPIQLKESLSPKEFKKEFTTAKSIIPQYLEIIHKLQQNQTIPNDLLVISKFHIESQDFMKFRYQNFSDSYLIERSVGSGNLWRSIYCKNKYQNDGVQILDQLRTMLKQIKKIKFFRKKVQQRWRFYLNKIIHLLLKQLKNLK